jgi:hypothetical protein
MTMPESLSHAAVKQLLVTKLKEWYGASLAEYPSSGHELDIFAVTASGVSIYIEIIWSPTKTQFLSDINMLQQSNADVKLVVVNPEIMANDEMVREFGKVVIAQRKQGKVVCGDLLNAVRIAESPEYVDDDLRGLIDRLISQARGQRALKKPELELLLVNEKGEAVKEIHAEPTFVKKIIKKVPRSMADYSSTLAQIAATVGSMPSWYEERKPPEDLVPIGMQITNVGDTPARGIRVSLEFPPGCMLMEKREAVGGIVTAVPISRNSGGLFVDDENPSEARAWIDTLGNDLMIKSFSKVYARFPAIEQGYKILGHITQYDFPPKDFEFLISVSPRFLEQVETVDEDEDP